MTLLKTDVEFQIFKMAQDQEREMATEMLARIANWTQQLIAGLWLNVAEVMARPAETLERATDRELKIDEILAMADDSLAMADESLARADESLTRAAERLTRAAESLANLE